MEQKDPNPFYILPKIHKKQLGTRPITASHSYALSSISSAVATYLQIHVNKQPTIARDTRSVLQRLETTKFHDNFVFVTYDVERLYPSINIIEAIQLISTHTVKNRDDSAWIKLLQLIMYNNYVSYNNQIYRQMQGTATGTQVAPQFANLYLHYLFEEILRHPSILFNSRYIDDGFLVVKTADDGKEIMEKLNKRSNLNLTFEINPTTAIYLDLKIYKGTRFKYHNILDVTTFFKPTNKLLYLPYSSCHPEHMKLGIAKGEAIRLLRNNCHKENWIIQCMYVFKGLMARGYPPHKIKKAWKTVKFEQRHQYIFENSVREKPPGQIIVTTYHPLTRIYWKYLRLKTPFQDIFTPNFRGKYTLKQSKLMQEWPPTIVYGNFRKIGQRLISAKQAWNYPFLRKRKHSDNGDSNIRPTKKRSINRCSFSN